MRLHFATIPVFGDGTAEAELNRFLVAHRVLSVERQLISAGEMSAWAVCVTYVEGEPLAPAPSTKRSAARIDYRDHLAPAEFAVFAKLRDLRKAIAEQEGAPLYALFTNEQLAAMVQQRVHSVEALGRIEGVGKGRLEKYGRTFVDALRVALDEADSGEGEHGTS